MSDDHQRAAGYEAGTRIFQCAERSLHGIEVECDDGKFAAGYWCCGFGRRANQARIDFWKLLLQPGYIFHGRCRGGGKNIVATIRIQGKACIHCKRRKTFTDFQEAQAPAFGKRACSLGNQFTQCLPNSLLAFGAKRLASECDQRCLARTDLCQRQAAVQQCLEMRPDSTDRVNDLEVVRVIGHQAVPDVTSGSRFILVGQDFPSVRGGRDGLIVAGQKQQMLKVRCNLRGGSLERQDFLGG